MEDIIEALRVKVGEAEQEAERLYQGGKAELEKLTVDAEEEVKQLILRLQNVLTKLQ